MVNLLSLTSTKGQYLLKTKSLNHEKTTPQKQ